MTRRDQRREREHDHYGDSGKRSETAFPGSLFDQQPATPADNGNNSQHMSDRARLPIAQMRVPPSQPSSETSIQSARAKWSEFPHKTDKVYHFILAQGGQGATRQEISDAIPLPIQSVCSTVNALVKRGRIASNPGHERVSKASNIMQEVLVEQRYVLRWQTK